MRFDDVRLQLARSGMPAPYIERVCCELAEHLEDATADLVELGYAREDAAVLAQRRLGDPLSLADGLSSRRRDGCLCLRWPAAFALGLPMLSFLALSATQLAAFYTMRDSLSPSFFEGLQFAARIGVTLLAMVGVYWVLNARIARRWVGVAVLVVAVLSASAVVRVEKHPDTSGRVILRLIP